MHMIAVQYTRPIIPSQNCYAFSKYELSRITENTET